MLSNSIKTSTRVSLLILLVLVAVSDLSAQSFDPATPAPIRSNNLLGKIVARDLGDSRLTHHYYTFTGTPGDLLITVQSRNLNGDLDVFTANGLRPLLKLTLYAESTTPVTKGIYLRKREDLILRIEARSPNDDEGSYQLFFGGSFEPVVGGPDNAETETAATESATASSDRKTKRVSSVGARLPEPEPRVTEVASPPSPTPEVTPAATPAATPAESASSSTEKATEEQPKATPPRSTARSRRPPPRRSSTPAKPKETEVKTAEEEAKKEETAEGVESPAKPKPTPRGSTRRGATSIERTTKPTTPAEPAPEPEPEIGPRLVIETNDGTLINRSMSTIRRVTVENGQVVVTGKDGKIDRILLVNVVRMSIAP